MVPSHDQRTKKLTTQKWTTFQCECIPLSPQKHPANHPETCPNIPKAFQAIPPKLLEAPKSLPEHPQDIPQIVKHQFLFGRWQDGFPLILASGSVIWYLYFKHGFHVKNPAQGWSPKTWTQRSSLNYKD